MGKPDEANSCRVEKCLTCGNMVMSQAAEYCRECGALLVNSCPNEDCDVDLLPWDIKHCEKCGEQTALHGQLEPPGDVPF